MFEFEDSKLGRVKVVNITEARAAIASIMNDKEFNYIITKNNKPVRVIINYDTFRKNQAHFTGIPGAANARKKEREPEIAPSSLIRGLIENREKEIRTHVQKPVKGPSQPETVAEPLQRAVNGEDFTAPSISEPFSESEPTGNYLESEESQDYFGATEEQGPSVTEPPAAQAAPAESPIPQAEESGDPVMDDYFNRYRKLYEPATRQERLDSQPLMARPDLSPPPRMPEPEIAREEAPIPRPIPREDPAAPHPVAKTSAREEPVSLQDLLKELENEQLSE